MNKVGERASHGWPPKPVRNLAIGKTVLYPENGTGIIKRGIIADIGMKAVCFTNGEWSHQTGLSEIERGVK